MSDSLRKKTTFRMPNIVDTRIYKTPPIRDTRTQAEKDAAIERLRLQVEKLEERLV